MDFARRNVCGNIIQFPLYTLLLFTVNVRLYSCRESFVGIPKDRSKIFPLDIFPQLYECKYIEKREKCLLFVLDNTFEKECIFLRV